MTPTWDIKATAMGLEMRKPARRERSEPETVRGVCPRCGGELVSRCYYVSGQGYLVMWECWSSAGNAPGCEYRRVL